jgi:uncharacterized protein involved in copper resistance
LLFVSIVLLVLLALQLVQDEPASQPTTKTEKSIKAATMADNKGLDGSVPPPADSGVVPVHEQDASQIEKGPVDHVHHSANLDSSAKASDYKADAIAAEVDELNMTVLQAVRAYPMATFWAFVMSFTIVQSTPFLKPAKPGLARSPFSH